MKNNLKILVIFLFVIFTGLVIFGYNIFKDRYSEEAGNENSSIKKSESPDEKLLTDEELYENDDLYFSDEADDESDLTEQQLAEDDSDDDMDVVDDEFLEITAEDCSGQCNTYIDSEDVSYCKQVCGLVDRKNPQKEDVSEGLCDKLSSLEKDYCLKDLAVAEKDLEICEKIIDINISKTCSNRVWEDLLESAPPLEG